MKLSDAVDEWVTSRKVTKARNTVRTDEAVLRRFLSFTGNVMVSNVTPKHVDRYLDKRVTTDGLAASTANLELDKIRTFFMFSARRRWLRPDDNPATERERAPEMEKARLFIPHSDFGRILDAATHPRDRIVIALGMYLFLRASEITSLRLRDVDLDLGEVLVTVHKSRKQDPMPISEELDVELRRWLAWATANTSEPLRSSHFLVPAKAVPTFRNVSGRLVRQSDVPNQLRWGTRYGKPEEAVRRALEAAGYVGLETVGCHILRASGARAFFDHLVDDRGHDGAARVVQAMLHHANLATTEKYLQIQGDRNRRDRLIRGERMFTGAGKASGLRRIGSGSSAGA